MKKSNGTAYETALRMLGRRSYSEKEVRDRLIQKGYDREDIEETVRRLYHYQYLDDIRLAGEIFSLYQQNLLYGDQYIQNKLRFRGLSLDRHLTEEEELEKARKAFQIRLRSTPDLCRQYRRAAGFLLRRGFSVSVVKAVLSEFEEE